MIHRDYKFIFVRTAKTGSTSIIENWVPGYISTSKLPDHMVLPGTNTWKHDNNHIPLYHVKENMSRGDFNTFYKFGFVRNPYDRVVSAYRYVSDWHMYHDGSNPYSDFKDFIIKLFVTKEKPSEAVKYGPQHVFVDGCDRVGKFENIQREYNIICDNIGVYPRRLPWENHDYAWRYLPKHGWSDYHKHNPLLEPKHYTSYYDDYTRSVIEQVFAQDLDVYNYRFG